jgi:hypothetical protein
MHSSAMRWARIGFSAGLLVMVAASAWAPAQPEVMTNGACEVDLCGVLEDPQRWRVAWILWIIGALATLAASVALARPRPGTALRRGALAALILLCLPITAVAAYLVSLGSSAQGFATVMWIFSLLPLVAFATPTLRAWADHIPGAARSDTRQAFSADRA